MGKVTCTTEKFGTMPNGSEVFLYRISSEKGITAEIISFGAIIHRLYVPDRSGKVADVLLGQDDLAGYQKKGNNFAAAFIGRVANRISNAEFSVNGKTYKTEVNSDGECTLHSGSGNYANRNFIGTVFEQENCAGVTLTLRDNGEGGFPGGMDVSVRYSLDLDGNLKLRYEGYPEADTPINFTNHAYFNLAGQGNGSIADQLLQMEADFVTTHEESGLPTGELMAVKDTDFDFTSLAPIGRGFNSKHPQLALGGYDNNFCIRGRGMRRAGLAKDPKSGRCMEFFTDLPGTQLYTMVHLFDKVIIGKDKAEYRNTSGFCLETQHYPDAPNLSQFPSPIYKSGERFISETIYKFYTE